MPEGNLAVKRFLLSDEGNRRDGRGHPGSHRLGQKLSGSRGRESRSSIERPLRARSAAPADILSMNGYVLNGRVHPHVTLSIGDHAFGGHLEPGTNVFTFGLVTLGILSTDADFSRFDDQTCR
ncbi:MAG: DUF296 domain-containing protein [Acidobacteriaceae bacterium]|nr:DUF296 domain-containing protein [Acidobacteriaceae bacterium]MBV9500725.1 DUF296 domain-containing protein [Acidobacteriaceae bacterium]